MNPKNLFFPGENFLYLPELSSKVFRNIIERETTCRMPVVLVSSPGFDPSGKVVSLASEASQRLSSVAMGSEEGYVMAEKAMTQAIKQGTWVLFKNVHLSASWLHELEKKFHRMAPADGFRLFLTMEVSQKIPLNLLRVSYTFLFEPPAGIRASLSRSYSTLLQQARTERPPVVARCRLHFLLAFLHAVALERRRYSPVGWCKPYEFSDADQMCALNIVDTWLHVAAASGGGTLSDHVDPEAIPWQAIRTLLSDVVYGGRLDNDVDSRYVFFLDGVTSPKFVA